MPCVAPSRDTAALNSGRTTRNFNRGIKAAENEGNPTSGVRFIINEISRAASANPKPQASQEARRQPRRGVQARAQFAALESTPVVLRFTRVAAIEFQFPSKSSGAQPRGKALSRAMPLAYAA